MVLTVTPTAAAPETPAVEPPPTDRAELIIRSLLYACTMTSSLAVTSAPLAMKALVSLV